MRVYAPRSLAGDHRAIVHELARARAPQITTGQLIMTEAQNQRLRPPAHPQVLRQFHRKSSGRLCVCIWVCVCVRVLRVCVLHTRVYAHVHARLLLATSSEDPVKLPGKDCDHTKSHDSGKERCFVGPTGAGGAGTTEEGNAGSRPASSETLTK